MPGDTNKKDQIKKQKQMLALQMLECALALIIFTAAVVAYVTKAWFVKNEKVEEQASTVTSTTTASLFIERGTTLPAQKNYYVAVSHEWQSNAALYPASTKNCTNWWYASQFSNVINNGNASLVATGYTQLTAGNTMSTTTVKEENNVGTYLNSLEGSSQRVAYLYEDYVLYTNNQSMDVYLHPTNPITVAYQDNAIAAKSLNEAIRVAIVVGDVKIFYAPTSETAAGNSSGAVTGYSNVKDASTVEVFTMTNRSTYQAEAGADENTFSAGTGKTSLGTATTTGLHVRMYVWLEGTDAQALIGVSDMDTKGLNVNVNFVGVTQE